MTVAFLGLGSNEGDRLGNLLEAVELLSATEGIAVVARSSVYETEPVGEVTDQRDFYNAVLRVETGLAPRELLATCKTIERRLGRAPGGRRHGPRPIDLDVLLIGDLVVAEADLVVPHPEVAKRGFVLAPLAEIDPDLRLPDGRTSEQALATLGSHERLVIIGPCF